MIDEKLKPWLIEINHLPSFAADTPLDTKIKKDVVTDAFRMLNVSIQDKIDYKNKKKAEIDQKALRSKKIKTSFQERQKLFEQAQIKRDEWETKNMGKYERIFPVEVMSYITGFI